MSTIISNFFSINGVISTGRTVMQNITALCDATGVFLTYDISVGAWSVIINAATASSKTFDDSNIIGAVNISGSGINEMYNSVSFEFPHKDLRDQTDYVEFKLPEADRYPNELDNELTMSTDLVNDPAVANYLAAVELKQSRLDKIITFATDYSSIGLQAGDIIKVTNAPLGFSSKQFRITRIEEAEDTALELNITALEYDPSIYNATGLIRTYRHKKTGIMPKAANTVLQGVDDDAAVAGITDSLSNAVYPALATTAFMHSLSPQSNVVGLTPLVHVFYTGHVALPAVTVMTPINLGYSFVLPYSGYYKTRYNINWGGSGAPGLNGVAKHSIIDIKIYGATVDSMSTGDNNVQLYEDHFLDLIWYGTAGQLTEMWFQYYTDWPTAAMWLNGETFYVQR